MMKACSIKMLFLRSIQKWPCEWFWDGRGFSRAASSALNIGASAAEGSSSAHEPFFEAFFRVSDFENEFQFQLQGYPRRAKSVNRPP
jgi:hypothetical protein